MSSIHLYKCHLAYLGPGLLGHGLKMLRFVKCLIIDWATIIWAMAKVVVQLPLLNNLALAISIFTTEVAPPIKFFKL